MPTFLLIWVLIGHRSICFPTVLFQAQWEGQLLNSYDDLSPDTCYVISRQPLPSSEVFV